MNRKTFKILVGIIFATLAIIISIQVRERVNRLATVSQKSKTIRSEKIKFTGYNQATYFEDNDMEGIVKNCIPFPTKNPVTFLTEVAHKGWNNNGLHHRMCISMSLLTNGQLVIVKRIALDDTESKRIPIAVPVTESGESKLLSVLE